MRQIIQSYKTGKLNVEDVPVPLLKASGLLVRNCCSLISPGTERTKIITAKKNILAKAKSRPDQVKLVIDNIKQEGIGATFKKVMNKLDSPISLGYSSAGVILAVSKEVSDFKIGDRVACAGEGYATHAEINSIPARMCVSIPGGLNFEQASFVGLGAIALQAVELAQLKVDERVAVIGLGLIGQLVAQILKARGAKVLGIEIDNSKILLAKELGMDFSANLEEDDVEAMAGDFSNGLGLDAVIITAASKDSKPIELAGKISRNKGRVILVGAMPIVIPRKDYYEKELFFIISRGLGAGVYFKEEDNDVSYPYNYKSRSARDNMIAFLRMAVDSKINLDKLITHRFNLDESAKAYKVIKEGKEKYIGMVFKYNEEPLYTPTKIFIKQRKKESKRKLNIGFIGAGSFSLGYILPVIKKIPDVNLKGIVTATGLSSKHTGKKFGFEYCASDYREVMEDKEIDCIFITTRHNLHAGLVIEALKKEKAVFVEKPLAINEGQLKEIIQIYKETAGRVMVGFNRRFSPYINELKNFYKNRIGPLVINYRINAGYLPQDHWLHDLREGGGRLIGEICHFVDLLQYLTASSPSKVFAESIGNYRKDMPEDDNLSITIKFADGSLGNIIYCAIGEVSYPRERIEVFGENSVAVIDNFRKAKFIRKNNSHSMMTLNRDMGHKNELVCFLKAVRDVQPMPINFREIVLSTRSVFKIVEALKKKQALELDTERLSIDNNE